MAENDSEIPMQRRRFLCHGRVYAEGKVFVALNLLKPDETESPKNWLFQLSSSSRVFRPGGIYSMETDGIGKVQLSRDWRYEGRWPNEEECAMYEAKTMAEEAQAAMHKRHKKDMEGNRAMMQALRPLRKEYTNTIATSGRIALELTVLRVLRTPYTKNEK